MSGALKCWLLLAIGCAVASAEGLGISRTRLVYTVAGPAMRLRVANDEGWPLLIEAWIDHGQAGGTPDTALAPLMPVPALFRLGPGESRELQLVGTADAAEVDPDRESLFWLNLHAVSPRSTPGVAAIELATRLQIKVLYRPARLPAVGDLAAQLQHIAQAGGVLLRNPTPFYMHLSGWQAQTTLLPPFSQQWLASPPAGAQLGLIDDDGIWRPYTASIARPPSPGVKPPSFPAPDVPAPAAPLSPQQNDRYSPTPLP